MFNLKSHRIASQPLIKRSFRLILIASCAAPLVFYFSARTARMDSSLGNVAVGTKPFAVAVNPLTNKIYVANNGGNNVTVIDGTNNSTTTVTVGTGPVAFAINTVTNKIYVANLSSANVTVIDGATNATQTITTGSFPDGIAVNPLTNKIYVANFGSNTVTVIDGNTNATATVTVGIQPEAAAVNPVTNKIYIPNAGSSNVTVIDGATNATTNVAAGSLPFAVTVNSVTNKIYVANCGSFCGGFGDGNVTVIDGTNNSPTNIAAGTNPVAVAFNPVTNKIYVANHGSANVTVIDGTNNSTTTVASGTTPYAVAVSPVTNKIYVPNRGSANVTIIDGTNNSTQTLSAGTGATAAVVNPVTSRIYVANNGTNDVTLIDGTPATPPNLIDLSTYFVQQQYLDFLNRTPDDSGFLFWNNQIASCSGDASCIDIKRQNVSAAYFLSKEFQETGFYVIKLQRAAFSKVSSDATKRITLAQFNADSGAVGKGFVDGVGGADAILNANKTAYAQTVPGSSAFIAKYPTSLSAAQFVDALYQTAGVAPQGTERQDAINAFGSGDTAGRAASLRKVAESNSIKTAEFNSAFVLLQYFGYLRRNPTDAPDNNDSGYQFWLNKLNSFNGDYIRSEMVRSFILSTEYRKRFSAP